MKNQKKSNIGIECRQQICRKATSCTSSRAKYRSCQDKQMAYLYKPNTQSCLSFVKLLRNYA